MVILGQKLIYLELHYTTISNIAHKSTSVGMPPRHSREGSSRAPRIAWNPDVFVTPRLDSHFRGNDVSGAVLTKYLYL